MPETMPDSVLFRTEKRKPHQVERDERWLTLFIVFIIETKNTKHLIAFLIYTSDSSQGYSFVFLVLEMLLSNRLSGRIHSGTKFVGCENAEWMVSFFNALQQKNVHFI